MNAQNKTIMIITACLQILEFLTTVLLIKFSVQLALQRGGHGGFWYCSVWPLIFYTVFSISLMVISMLQYVINLAFVNEDSVFHQFFAQYCFDTFLCSIGVSGIPQYPPKIQY